MKHLTEHLFLIQKGMKLSFQKTKFLSSIKVNYSCAASSPSLPQALPQELLPLLHHYNRGTAAWGTRWGAGMNDFNKPYNFYFSKYWRNFSSLQLHKQAFQLSLKG